MIFFEIFLFTGKAPILLGKAARYKVRDGNLGRKNKKDDKQEGPGGDLIHYIEYCFEHFCMIKPTFKC